MTPIQKEVQDWLETWAPHCGAPRSVFEGQFGALMENVLREIVARASGKYVGTSVEVFVEIKRAIKERR